jgi:hypothetical protein
VFGHIGGKIFTFPHNASFVLQTKQHPPFLVEDCLVYPKKNPPRRVWRSGLLLGSCQLKFVSPTICFCKQFFVGSLDLPWCTGAHCN